MRERVSPTVEEYLEAIFRLEEKTGLAKTGDLAEQLKVALGTITNTVESLEKQGLINHEPYKGVRLTERGRKIALDVIRRHRLSERLLTDILHMDWSDVHEAACRLEHDITNSILVSLESTLGKPKTCPHGNPIPDGEGRVTEVYTDSLANLSPKEKGVIVKVTEEKPDLLRYLATLGLMPGTLVEVEEKAPFKGPIIVKAMGASYALGREVASILMVKKT